ncbi:MAG: hypothetical protein HZA00_12980 [Nitrospinae bacterium]|nr:hypothetical protein [Nitrospinota bacterium]
MSKEQRKSVSKYFYDMSKGIALLTVVGNIIKDEWDIPVMIFGVIETVLLFVWAYIIEGGVKNE